MPNVAGWPASCREGFEGCRGGRFRRLSSKAAVHGLHVPEAPSPGCDAGVGQRRWEGFEGGPKCLTLLSEAHKNRKGRPGTGEEKRQACQLPRTVWGRSKMSNVAGWPATCREGFEGCRGGRFRRLSSKAAVHGLHVPEAPSPGCDAGVGQRRWEGFQGGPKCLMLLSEAHKNRRGRPGTGEEKRQACQLPRTVWGRFKMPNVACWPASCRKGFEGCRGGRFRRLSSKAAVHGLHVQNA